ncbi:MAG: MMPL family transporter [Planctomycetes bacterium]|nr:MMPL family transporter [Planctomycetota bacterium]MBI3848053.1 MMPL family transporter [Planctomycetota bacterium]
MERLVDKLFAFCVRRPRVVLALAALVTLVAAPGLWRLRLRTDGHALVPTADPRVVYDAEVRSTFGIQDPIVVTITTTDPAGVFNPRALALVRDLSTDFSAIPGVEAEDVVSLATEKRDRVRAGTLEFQRFLEPFPDDAASLSTLRDDVHVMHILRGTLVSDDEKSAAILVGTRPDHDRVRLHDDVQTAIARRDASGHVVRVVGAAVAEALLGRHLLEDLTVLVPIVIAVIAILIFWQTRSAWAVLLALSEVAATILFTFGVMGFAGVPIYLTMVILPVSLTAVGVADDIHVFSRYRQRLEREIDASDAAPVVRDTMREIWRAIGLTSLTTAVGFLSFTSASIAPVQAFGVFECVGVVFAMAWTFAVTPAALAMIPVHRLRPRRDVPLELRGFDAVGLLAGAFVVRRRLACLALIALLAALAPFGVRRLYVQDSWIDGFSPGSDFRRDTAFVHEHFLGTHLLQVAVDAGTGTDRLLQPATLAKVGALEDFLRGLPSVGGVLGVHSHLATMNFLLHGRREEFRGTPGTIEEARRAVDYMDRFRSRRRRREVLDDARSRGLVTVFLRDANFVDTAKLMDAARGFEARELQPAGLKIEFAGDVGVSQAMIPAIVDSQIGSMLLTLAGIWLLAALMTRSIVEGTFCVLPASIAALFVFGIMGALGIPLGVATSTFCAITLGIGVDYGIHLVEAARARMAAGATRDRAIIEAMATSGRSITVDALAIAVGFGVLAFSQVPANQRLGLLIALSIALSWAVTMLALPALLAFRPAKGVRPQ